jgi:hypothetical protein
MCNIVYRVRSWSIQLRMFLFLIIVGLVLSVSIRTTVLFLVTPDPTVLLIYFAGGINLLHLLIASIAFRFVSHRDVRKEVVAQNPWRLRLITISIHIMFMMGFYVYLILKRDAQVVEYFRDKFALDDTLFGAFSYITCNTMLVLVSQELPINKRMHWRVAIMCYQLLSIAVLLSFALNSDLSIILVNWMSDITLVVSTSICACIAGLEREPNNHEAPEGRLVVVVV